MREHDSVDSFEWPKKTLSFLFRIPKQQRKNARGFVREGQRKFFIWRDLPGRHKDGSPGFRRRDATSRSPKGQSRFWTALLLVISSPRIIQHESSCWSNSRVSVLPGNACIFPCARRCNRSIGCDRRLLRTGKMTKSRVVSCYTVYLQKQEWRPCR
jgi:hypothetical protein